MFLQKVLTDVEQCVTMYLSLKGKGKEMKLNGLSYNTRTAMNGGSEFRFFHIEARNEQEEKKVMLIIDELLKLDYTLADDVDTILVYTYSEDEFKKTYKEAKAKLRGE